MIMNLNTGLLCTHRLVITVQVSPCEDGSKRKKTNSANSESLGDQFGGSIPDSTLTWLSKFATPNASFSRLGDDPFLIASRSDQKLLTSTIYRYRHLSNRSERRERYVFLSDRLLLPRI